MKTIKTLCIVFSLATLMAACTKNETNDLSPKSESQNLKQGSWRVSHYSEREKDETHKFNGYKLNFQDGGLFTLSNSSATFTGTWSIDPLSDDSSSSSHKLIIMISGNEIADQLVDDWRIVQMTDDFIQLEDDSDDHTELLELTKN